MSEWWTYRPSDFLMFSPRIYWRLFEAVNLAAWPGAAAAVGVLLLGLRLHARLALVGLAGCWAWVAWAFLGQRYAPIFWVADIWAGLFAAQALAWLALAAAGPLQLRWHPVAVVLGAWALLGQPLLAPLSGRPFAQAELLGLAPDPTALAGLALCLALRRNSDPALRVWPWAEMAAWAAWGVVPLAWCLFSAATLAIMGEWQALLPLTAAVAAAAAALGAACARFRSPAPG